MKFHVETQYRDRHRQMLLTVPRGILGELLRGTYGFLYSFLPILELLWFFFTPCKILQSKTDSIRLVVYELASLH